MGRVSCGCRHTGVSASLATLLACAGGHPWAQAVPSGVIVERATPGDAAARAALEAGDRIVQWRTRADGHWRDVGDTFAFMLLESEKAPRFQVTFAIVRDGRRIEVTLPDDRWGIVVRPAIADEEPASPDKAPVRQGHADGAGRTAASVSLAAAAHLAETDPRVVAQHEATVALAGADPLVRAMAARSLGRLHLRALRLEPAAAALASAASGYDESNAPLARAAVLIDLARVRRTGGNLEGAGAAVAEAEQVARAQAPDSLLLAAAVTEAGSLALARRDLGAAERAYDEARGLIERRRPDSRDLAAVLVNRGLVDMRRARLVDAERWTLAALEILDRVDRQSIERGRALNQLAIVAAQRGDFPAAAPRYAEALAIAKAVGNRQEEASTLNNLGILTMQRGDLEAADRYFATSLAIKEQLELAPADLASTLGNLGLLATERHDLDAAERYYKRSLEMVRAATPDSGIVGSALNNLAKVTRLGGDAVRAEAFARESLEHRERRSPESLDVAFSLTELGKTLGAQRRFDEAAAAHARALSIREKLAPGSTQIAESLEALAAFARARGDLANARSLGERAVAIWSRMAPGGAWHAHALHSLALTHRDAGRRPEALAGFAEATAALDDQTVRLGGPIEVQSEFRLAIARYYEDYIDLLIEAGRGEDAFHVLERARARVFLAALAERDLVFAGDVPPDLERERRLLASEYDRGQAQLRGLATGKDNARIEALRGELHDVRSRQARVIALLKEASPRLASLRAPEPLDVGRAQAALDPDTLLLAYAVGQRATHVFIVSRTTFRTERITITRPVLAELTARFRRALERGRTEADPAPVVEAGRRLYDLLLTPAAPLLGARTRLLVAADGPLGEIPFGALVRNPSRGARRPRYLIDDRPVHHVASATVYDHLRRESPTRRHAPGGLLVAFADPGVSAPVDGARSEHAAAHAPAALPGARAEVDALARAFGGEVETFVGTEATERAVRERAPSARYLHFAVHGVLNVRAPLDSGLLLAPPAGEAGGDNGLLQAWEVLETLRTRAELVVLSACETAVGHDAGPEGLVGLARAFHYAGAPSVVATLWRIPDATSPAMMRHFYTSLRRGRPKDESLASAQRAMLQSAQTAHPYHWAAFVLLGDPR